MDTERIDALQKLPALKGAALSIVLAMLFAQRPLMAQELETYTGYSNPAITKGLRKLAHFRAIVSVGKGRGYILTPAWRQLALPLSYPQDNQEMFDLPADNQEMFDYPGPIVVSSSDPDEEEDLLTNQLPPPNQQNLDLVDREEVAAWLIRGGIIKNSPKMIFLAQKIQSPEYVKAHVLEHLHEHRAWEKAANKNREPGTGTLIYRLERGWDAPPMRCESCLERERDCRCNGRLAQQIPDDLKGIVKR